MPRPATGSPRWNPKKKIWEARVSIPGKGREPVAMKRVPACLVVPTNPPPKCACASCVQARDVAKIMSDRIRLEGRVPEETAETANEWHGRYIKVRKALEIETRGMHQWNKWVGPAFGTTPMADVTHAQIVQVRDALRAARHAEEDAIGAKRISNLWSELVLIPFSIAFDDDPKPEYKALIVGPASANLTLEVKPPVTQGEKEEDKRDRQHLYPREFLRLISCTKVPVE